VEVTIGGYTTPVGSFFTYIEGENTFGPLGARGVVNLPSRMKAVKGEIIIPNPLSNSENK
jgi:hypothetical protein